MTLTGCGASTNADLSNLSLSTGTLNPVFAAATTSYTSSVANGVSNITVTPTAADANSTITVNGNAVTSGSPSGSINLNVGVNTITTVVTAQDLTTTKTYTVDVTRAAAGVASITNTGALAGFGNVCINSTAGPNSFTIDGANLDGSNINIAALSGFSYCETAGGTYTSTLSFSYTGNSFTGKVIYVNFSPTAVQSYDGNIVLSGGGVAGFNVAATGSGVNTAAVVTTGTPTTFGATTATLPGTITTAGCSPVTVYGIEYSTVSGFGNGTGTQVAASNLSAGNYSVNLTGLTPNVRIYYKAYLTDGSGTIWGAQQAFNLNPLPVPMALQPSLTFTENFADIASWSDFFITGTGANHWDGLSAVGSGGIPNGTTLTTATNQFIAGNPGTSGGVQRGTEQVSGASQSIVLLSTGTSNNTTSAAIDFYADFTGVNAGTLSFDYSTINNGAGDRPGSLRVYGSVDGISYTEITNVINFTNNTPLSDSKTNIPLPAAFNNNANARIRFYYYNGETGGSSGARPKLAIDNVKITAIATTPCVAPSAPATALTFGTITDVSIAGSFTAASPAADGYIVVASVNSSLANNPVNGQVYNIGDNLGDGTVVSNGSSVSFTAAGLNPLTTYYFFVIPVNSICTGGPLYYTTTILTGSATTIAGLPPCAAPASQPTGLVFGTTTTTSIQGSFSATTADEYLVVRSTAASLGSNPVNGTVYNTGDALGGGIVVQRGAATTFTANSLTPNTTYYFFVFALNSAACINGPAYNTASPLSSSQNTQPLPPCAAPSAQPTTLILSSTNTAVSGTFTGVASADDYLVVRSSAATLSAAPADNTDYNVGDAFGGGIVVANSSNTSFVATGLTPGTTYYFFVFAANKICSGGTKYAAGAPLSGNIATTNTAVNNYYFGTLHSHSDYSDGNTDNPGYTPAQDYAFAKTAQCMDFLGISEHNHYTAECTISNYHLGVSQANTFTSANPGFLALYGMEWGTISGGGHVLIYGDGMDNLWGWESGSGAWGASNNYDVYVPKSVYTGGTGLFKTVNDNIATNTFASLAHPGTGDFNNLDAIAYDVVADNAITAVAVESGPSTSANITYSNPGSSMSYLWYYQLLLSKGYHLGPTIDHDNHKTTFGKTTYSRTAVIAPSVTKSAIVNAVRNMNFYATQDCDAKVDFNINARIMGSIFTDRYAPNINVTLTDATTSTASAIIRVMYGVPGSGVLPVKIDSVIGSTLSFTNISQNNLSTGYYYIDITNGSSRIVTSPIWYTRDDAAAGGPLPVKLSAFTVQKVDNTAKLNWTTEIETNSSHFVVERSTNGSTWNTIATVAAKGNSSIKTNYEIYDNAPVRGINYYRLRQVDKDGRFELSAVRNALFDSRNIIEIAPNPAKDFINLYIGKLTGSQAVSVQLLNASGKLVYSTTSTQQHIQISTMNLAKGLYFAKVITAEGPTTLRVLVD
ncbi:MAG: cadherin-like beta sandwich domain-containing protein [Ferruginibacter sp.]